MSFTVTANTNVKAELPDLFTKLEVLSVRALIGYVAHNRNVNELIVRKMLLNNFQVSGIEELSKDQYDEVIRFLTHLPANTR